MIFSVFPGGAGSAGYGGEGDAGELFNFPMTIDQYPPDNPGQGRQEGHIWLVMSKELVQGVHNIMFDRYGSTVNYPPGTLLLIVPKLGKSKIYVNRGKETGSVTLPMVYQPEDTELETHWPVTLISQDGAQARLEISRPEGHARLITETGWENIPIYYFNGTEWEAPETWDYIYWDSTRNTTTGVDTLWQAFKLDTETFLPIRKKIPELSLTEIVKTIRLSNGNVEPRACMNVFPGGWGVLGMGDGVGMARNDSSTGTTGRRRFLYDGRAPHWYFLEITKKQISYVGQMAFSANTEEGMYPYQIVVTANSQADIVKKHRAWLGAFYQTSAVDKGVPAHLTFRRYSVDRERHELVYWESNAASLNQTVMDAVLLDEDSGYLLTCDSLNPTELESSTGSVRFYIQYFQIKGDMLVLRQTNFSGSISASRGCRCTAGHLNLQNPRLCGPHFSGITTSNNYYYYEQGAWAIDEDAITFRKIASSGWSSAAASYTQYNIPLLNKDGTRFRLQQLVRSNNTNTYTTTEYELAVSPLGVVSWPVLATYANAPVNNTVNYLSQYQWPPYLVNLPGARDDEVLWMQSYINKVDPKNPNAPLDVNSFGVSGMVSYSNIGSLGNLAVASQLPDR